jgi:hypothetical protein
MDETFLIKLLLSFIVGGSYIAFTIWLSEKFGSKIGGLVIGLPSTTLMSLIFIAITQSDAVALAAVPIMPMVFGSNTLCVAAFVLLQKRGLKIALAAFLAIWLVLNCAAIVLNPNNIWVSLAVAALFYAVSTSILNRFPHRNLPPAKFSKSSFLFRSGFAGAIVASAVCLAKTLGPAWGGVFGSFPAAFTSSLLMISKKHGHDFAASVSRSMPYGSMGTVAFLVAFYFSVPVLGFWVGIAIGMAISLAAGYLFYKFLM